MFEMRFDHAHGGIPAIHFGSWTHPEADNNNWLLCYPDQTHAEVMQIIQRLKREMRAELIADFRLRQCPTHRRHWETLHAMERCARWHFYGEY